MKKSTKIAFIIVIIVAIIGLSVGYIWESHVWKEIYYNFKFNQFEKENKTVEKNQIVFVGDSITDYCDLEEFYPTLKAYNRGISADTTDGLLNRMDESIFDLEPKLVVLLMGINDLLGDDMRSEEAIASNMDKILTEIQTKSPNTKIILQAPYPVSAKSAYGRVANANGKVKKLSAMYEAIANAKGITYVDLYDNLIDPKTKEFDLDYTNDGLHPNGKGYEVISAVLNPVIQSVLAQ